jgi:hypothetical protein
MAFNKYAAGRKIYGGGRDFPTNGKVDPTGYSERDRKNAVLRRMKALQKGKIYHPDVLRNL